MTDNEITKALEEWIKALKDDYKRLQALDAPMDCFEESHTDNIRILSNALDLINRKNVEIESLQKMQQLTKAEAVKKCIEKIQLRSGKSVMIDHGIQVAGSATYWISEVTLCEIEKEMVGGSGD